MNITAQFIKRSVFASTSAAAVALGLCPVMAVSVSLTDSAVLALCTILTSAFSCATVSALRRSIPIRFKTFIEIVVLAFFITIASEIVKACSPTMGGRLYIYLGLLLANCLILDRLESYAMSHKPMASFFDGVLHGALLGGFLMAMALIRELFGAGTLFGARIIPHASGWITDSMQQADFFNPILLLPPMAMIIAGGMIWILRTVAKKRGRGEA